ncbi:MAG: glucose 1-dehydrogenase [Pseudomonadales bacterium]|nr:glucose 1-dehydrogenase [Pseudomonadales bacterium]
MGRAAGKVAIVTGAANGLGAASARALHAEGAAVVVADIDTNAGTALVESLGKNALFLKLDVSQEQQWIDVMAATLERFGKLDVLVNNAGVVVMATIEDTTLEQLKFVQSVNIDGPFLGCKHALPAMTRSGGGSIINISSIAAMVGTPPFAAYSASKGAVRSITQTVAAHCKMRRNGIRCNSIHPGSMETDMTASLLQLGATSPLAVELMLEMGSEVDRYGKPEDVAAAVVYLASDESNYVSGSMLVIDDAATAV